MAGLPASPSEPAPDSAFEVVRKGYDQGQVDAHLRSLDAQLRIYVTDRDAAVDQADQLARELDDARAHADRMRAQVKIMVEAPQSAQGMSERMRSMLRLAQDEVAEMRTRAETEVNRRVIEADRTSANTLAAARDEAARIRADAEADAQRQRTTLAAEREEFDRQRAEAWQASEDERAAVENDFKIAMDQRRSEALHLLTQERLAARRHVEEQRESAARSAAETIAQAQRQAADMVRAAERQVAELQALRARIAEQLGGAGATIERTLTALTPFPAEQAEHDDARNGAPNGTYARA